MSNKVGRKTGARVFQGPIRHQHNSFHAENNILEDAILAATGISCSVKVTSEQVKIRAPSYSDYILARAAIRDRVTAEIVRG